MVGTEASTHAGMQAANQMVAFATGKIDDLHGVLEDAEAKFQPYFADVDIYKQKHRYIDIPLLQQAELEIISAKDWLNRAGRRLQKVRVIIQHNGVTNINKIIFKIQGVHAILALVRTHTREVNRLFLVANTAQGGRPPRA